jgi:hypothetical protein
MPVTDRRLDSYKARPWHCVLKGKGTRGIKTREETSWEGKDIESVGVKITQVPSLHLSTSEAACRAKSTQRPGTLRALRALTSTQPHHQTPLVAFLDTVISRYPPPMFCEVTSQPPENSSWRVGSRLTAKLCSLK